jgi:hypothetical protein
MVAFLPFVLDLYLYFSGSNHFSFSEALFSLTLGHFLRGNRRLGAISHPEKVTELPDRPQ